MIIMMAFDVKMMTCLDTLCHQSPVIPFSKPRECQAQ